MRDLETDNEPETEAGYADQGITDDIYHIFPSFLSLPLEFVNNRDNRVSVGTFFRDNHEPPGVMHDQELVPENHPDSERDYPDTNQNVRERVRHSASH
jgi:hypothetical protein